MSDSLLKQQVLVALKYRDCANSNKYDVHRAVMSEVTKSMMKPGYLLESIDIQSSQFNLADDTVVFEVDVYYRNDLPLKGYDWLTPPTVKEWYVKSARQRLKEAHHERRSVCKP